MGLKIRNGEYVPNGTGGFAEVEGREALMQRVLFKLTARRGAFPFLDTLGSRLYQLGRCPAGQRAALAEQAVSEALADEPDLRVAGVTLRERGEAAELLVELIWQGEELSVTMTVQ